MTPVHLSHPPQSLFDTRMSALTLATALLPLVLVGWSAGASAQNAPPPGPGPGPVPGAGQVLKQLEPLAAPAPLGAPGVPLRIEPAAAANAPADAAATAANASAVVAVKTIELSGNTAFDTATLHALVASAEGTSQTLAQLEALAQRLTTYYRAHGHPLASAYLPVQALSDGVLRIAIVEVVYGRVSVVNRSRLDTAQIEAYAAALQPGQLVTQAPLDRTLLLLRELGGVEVTAAAAPGALPGSTELTLTAVDAVRTSGLYSLDTQGSKAAGRTRALGVVEFSNTLGRGDKLSVAALSSGTGLNYGRLDLQAPLNGAGTWAGLGYAQLRYVLGDVFASLHAHGTAQVASGFVQQALVRTPRASLNAELHAEYKVLKDRVDSVGTHTDRTVRSLTPELRGQLRDDVGGGSTTSVVLGATAGHVRFDDDSALGVDQGAAGPHTRGRYARLNLELTRLQKLGGDAALAGTTVLASVRAQRASTNLDVSEQISVAGPQGVRGYDVNALSGAQGYVATLEVRQALASTPGNAWAAKAFADAGQVTVYKNVFSAVPNSASMRSVGLGVNWTGAGAWNAELVLAHPVGAAPAIAVARNTRAWLTVGGRF